MAEIINFKTPAGGSSRIVVDRTLRGIELKFVRELGDGVVRSESIVAVSLAQALQIGRAMIEAAGESPERRG